MFSFTPNRLLAGGILSFVLVASPAYAQEPAAADTAATPDQAAATPSDATPVAEAPASGDAAPASPDGTATAAPATAPESVATIPVNAKTEEELVKSAESGQRLDAVEVTGSRIKRTQFETSQPISLIKRDDIDRSGVVNIGELLQDLPSAGSALNTQFNNGGTGATEIDLRNLGSNRVLVLVNGHRWVNGLRSLSTSSVDLNTIPLAIIERIEILQDGASAIYGSDAITGVVNIITRKNFSGTELSAQYGEYTDKTGAQQNHSLSWGNTFNDAAGIGGTTSLFGNINFSDEKGIPTSHSKISELPKYGTGLTRGSSFLPQGRFLFVPSQTNGAELGTTRCPSLSSGVIQGTLDGEALPGMPQIPGPVAGGIDAVPGVQLCDMTIAQPPTSDAFYSDYRARVAATDATHPGDTYNYAAANLLTTPLRTYGAFVGLQHQFDSGVGTAVELMYDKRQSKQQLATQPICVGNICPIVGGVPPGSQISYNQATYISASNPFNPFGQDIGRVDPNDPTNSDPCTTVPLPPACGPAAGLVGQGGVLYRPLEAGPRVQDQQVPTMFGHIAVNGAIDMPGAVSNWLEPLNWEIGFGYGRSKQTNKLFNSLRVDRIQNGLGDNCTGDCVPLNILGGPGSFTESMLNYIRYDAVDYTEQKQRDIYANFSLNLTNILPAGPLGIAFGFESRKDEYQFQPDQTEIDGTTAGLSSAPTKGSVQAKEYFVELQLPIIKDLPFINDLKLDLAGRSSNYATFGSSKNGKIGIEYRPVSDLLLRSAYSTSFRAPDVGNLYLGRAASYPGLSDPCVTVDSTSARQPGNTTDQNCTADGVGSGTAQNFAQIVAPFGGNPNLKPESSHSLSAGMVFSPEAVRGLDLSVDYFYIKLKNFITVPGAQTNLDLCYESVKNRQGCEFVHRNSVTQELSSVDNIFDNFPAIETSGFDYSITYKVPTEDISSLAGMGHFKLAAAATFLSSYNQYSPDITGEIEKQGFAGQNLGDTGYPRWRANPSLEWSNGDWVASWNTRIVGEQTESCDDGLTPSLSSLGLCSDPTHKDKLGNPAPQNKLKATAKHDIQLGYNFEAYKANLVFGVQNVFNTNPPVSMSAFANSMDASDYWVPGVLPYLRLNMKF